MLNSHKNMNAKMVHVEKLDEMPNFTGARLSLNIAGESSKANWPGLLPCSKFVERKQNPTNNFVLLDVTQNDDSEEECEEIICDKENAFDPKTG